MIQYLEQLLSQNMLKPQDFAPSGEPISLDSLVEYVTNQIKSFDIDSIKKQILTDIFILTIRQNVIDRSSMRKNGIIHFETTTEKIPFAVSDNPNLIEQINTLTKAEIGIIGKNFGEILGAAYLLNSYKASSVTFPANKNNPLFDYKIEEQEVSAKSKQGAPASVDALYTKIKDNPIAQGEIAFDILKIFYESGIIESTINVHNFLKTGMKTKIKTFLGIDIKKIMDRSFLNETIYSKIGELIKDKKAKDIAEASGIFFDTTLKNLFPNIFKPSSKLKFIQLAKENKRIEGFVIAPLQRSLIKYLNTNNKIKISMKNITTLAKVYQLHIWTIIERGGIIFDMKKFEEEDFKFSVSGMTFTNYIAKIGFKMNVTEPNEI